MAGVSFASWAIDALFQRPAEAVVGHIGTSEFVGIWGDGENSFAADPPNAVLMFILHWPGISATGSVGPRRDAWWNANSPGAWCELFRGMSATMEDPPPRAAHIPSGRIDADNH